MVVKIRLIAVSLMIALLLCACGGQNEAARQPQVEIQGQTMGTTYSIKVVPGKMTLDVETLRREIDADLLGINQVLSTYIQDSELSEFNRSEVNQWHPASSTFLTVLNAARGIYELSQGAFDPSIGPLVNLWGFGPEVTVEFPTETELQKAKDRVDFARLSIDIEGMRLRKSSDMYVDLSAIAKGYGVDRVATLLASQGYTDYLVEIGGELRSVGLNAEGQAWRIAIEKPQAGTRTIHGIINVSDMGMATSGDYRNFFEHNGQRYSHTIDPRTGYPVRHSLVSVTVLADDAMTADALATAFMVMGAEEGFVLARNEKIAAWFIEQKDDELLDRLTPKMESYRLH